MPKPNELAGMPAAARTIILTDSSLYLGADRGVVRNSNDATMDNRTTHFCNWLITSAGYNYLCCAQAITPVQAGLLIASYLDHMARTPWNSHGSLRTGDTLQKFVNAAAEFLSRIMTTPFVLQRTVASKVQVDPAIAQRLAFYRKWDAVRPKREPYTMEMFDTFRLQVEKAEKIGGESAFLTIPSLVYDTQTLGIFTGSHVSEYAQSKGARHIVSRTPPQPGAPATTHTTQRFIRNYRLL